MFKGLFKVLPQDSGKLSHCSHDPLVARVTLNRVLWVELKFQEDVPKLGILQEAVQLWVLLDFFQQLVCQTGGDGHCLQVLLRSLVLRQGKRLEVCLFGRFWVKDDRRSCRGRFVELCFHKQGKDAEVQTFEMLRLKHNLHLINEAQNCNNFDSPFFSLSLQ